MASIIQIRRDTAANWTAADPTLAECEIGIETDTELAKLGDGVTAWTALGYWSLGGGGSGTVGSIVAGAGIDVDATDPANPEVALDSATIASLALADSATQPGDLGTMAAINDAPSDGTGYVRKDGAWEAESGGGGAVSSVNGDTGAVIVPVPIGIACSDESTNLAAGTAKATFRMPFAMTLTDVRASLSTAQTAGSIFTVDVNEGGTTILSTKITIDNNEKTSVTATTPPVISDASLADDAEMTVDIDQVGTAGAKGLKVWLIGYPA